ETLAIANWLEHRDTERRISFAPAMAETRRLYQLMAFINTGFTGAFTPLWMAWEMTPADPAVQRVLQSVGRDRVIDRHDKLEHMLGDSPFLVGRNPTLADAVFLGVTRWLDIHQVADPARWPKIAAMRARIAQTEAAAFALA